jgi:hypothetical protein
MNEAPGSKLLLSDRGTVADLLGILGAIFSDIGLK